MKYFSVMSQDESLTVESCFDPLFASPWFDWKVPNLVRSLLGGLSRNTLLFHKNDLSGYQYYLKKLRHLDTINPQIAARLSKQFSCVSDVSPERRKQIESLLSEFLKDEHISSGVREILSKFIESDESY